MHLLQNQTVLSHCLHLFSFSLLHSRRQTRVSDAIFPVQKEGQRPRRCLGPCGVQPPHPERHTPPVFHYLDSRRQGTASTKTRGEVRGSGRKIRPQKGTGRARLGDGQLAQCSEVEVSLWPQTQRFQHKAQPQGHSDGHAGRTVCKTQGVDVGCRSMRALVFSQDEDTHAEIGPDGMDQDHCSLLESPRCIPLLGLLGGTFPAWNSSPLMICMCTI